jgi:hypothetical protein
MFRHNVIRGKKCEQEFEMLLKRKGIFDRKATEQEDRFDHIDFWLKFQIPEASQVSMSVDVKSLKKVRGQFQDELFYVELINDNGNKGWVHAPKMDLVAFECYDGFRMYRRESLVKFIHEKGMKSFQVIERRLPMKDTKSCCVMLPRAQIEHLLFYMLLKSIDASKP